jgi:hypothetical protein
VSAADDAHSEMLQLAVQLAEREASGQPLSVAQRVIADIMWIGTQVSPNGFYEWLACTSCERISSTLEALAEVGCLEVAEAVKAALAIADLNPQAVTEAEREPLLDALTDDIRGRLERVDWRFHEVYEASMVLCRHYALEKGVL